MSLGCTFHAQICAHTCLVKETQCLPNRKKHLKIGQRWIRMHVELYGNDKVMLSKKTCLRSQCYICPVRSFMSTPCKTHTVLKKKSKSVVECMLKLLPRLPACSCGNREPFGISHLTLQRDAECSLVENHQTAFACSAVTSALLSWAY